MKHPAKAITLAALILTGLPAAATDPSPIERRIDMLRWQERIFKNSTTYRSVMLNQERVLRAEADGSASALYQTLNIDLNETPYLHWRWRIERTFGSDIDERSHDGDDYPVRVYLIRNGGLAFWRTKAINYVWSSGNPAGTHWDNPYAGRSVQMWAVNSGDADVGEWLSHTRDIRADWRAAFGEEIDSLDGLAVMTDSDNTGIIMRAWYADIRFSSSP